MTEKLRFTGEWPPIQLWVQYPNWEYALDEEGADGQDETTLRPAKIQTHIYSDVAFTAGEAIQADGKVFPALLEVYTGPPDGVNVFVNDKDAWRIISGYGGEEGWKAYIEDWLPEERRGISISLKDPCLFPLRVRSNLPGGENETRYDFIIQADGTQKAFS